MCRARLGSESGSIKDILSTNVDKHVTSEQDNPFPNVVVLIILVVVIWCTTSVHQTPSSQVEQRCHDAPLHAVPRAAAVASVSSGGSERALGVWLAHRALCRKHPRASTTEPGALRVTLFTCASARDRQGCCRESWDAALSRGQTHRGPALNIFFGATYFMLRRPVETCRAPESPRNTSALARFMLKQCLHRT